MTFKDIHQSKTVRGILIGLGIAIVVLGIFKVGEFAGYHKARFSEGFGDNFKNSFSEKRDDMFFGLGEDSMVGGHGAAGRVVSVALPKIVIAGPDNLEKTIRIDDKTLIRKYQKEGSQKDLFVDDFVVVLGEPDANGEIAAKLIRIMPTPPLPASSTSSR